MLPWIQSPFSCQELRFKCITSEQEGTQFSHGILLIIYYSKQGTEELLLYLKQILTVIWLPLLSRLYWIISHVKILFVFIEGPGYMATVFDLPLSRGKAKRMFSEQRTIAWFLWVARETNDCLINGRIFFRSIDIHFKEPTYSRKELYCIQIFYKGWLRRGLVKRVPSIEI